ncbi:helix-turn-helix domain-containing protein [Streptomyces sp. NPDC055287]
MRTEIERVVQGIRERYEEPLSLNDLGEIARLTPYHMARVFREETGLPPARFLTAVRLEEAKRRLLCTNESIADISIRVGYCSIGAFTTRFSKTFGVPPGQYRRLATLGPDAVQFAGGNDDEPFSYGTILGRIRRRDGMAHAPAFVAAFHATAATDRPARCCRVERSSDVWTIAHVPAGRWLIEAVSQSVASGSRSAVVAGTAGPVHIEPGTIVEVDVSLEPSERAKMVDGDRCPLAFSLPDLYAS